MFSLFDRIVKQVGEVLKFLDAMLPAGRLVRQDLFSKITIVPAGNTTKRSLVVKRTTLFNLQGNDFKNAATQPSSKTFNI